VLINDTTTIVTNEHIRIAVKATMATEEAPLAASQNEVSPSAAGVEDVVTRAEAIKGDANERFKAQAYEAAIELYGKALALTPDSAVLHANRSIANLRVENFGYALADANKAIELDKSYLKAYYRRAAAHMALGKYKLALRDYERVYKVRPADKDAKAKFTECKKIVQQIAFQRAIAVEESARPSVADSVNVEAMRVEESYDGPRLSDDGVVTAEFMEELLECYREQKRLHKRYAFQMLLAAKKYFEAQPTLVDVSVAEGRKFTVCGDIHGQFYDLLNVFAMNGRPSENNPYLFNGDFVDRGSFSVECIFALLGFKLLYPDHFFMSRGNHESENMNKMYGFEGEVKAKYSAQMAELFTEIYNWLPLAHCINGKVLVMHGGLFAKVSTMKQYLSRVPGPHDRRGYPDPLHWIVSFWRPIADSEGLSERLDLSLSCLLRSPSHTR